MKEDLHVEQITLDCEETIWCSVFSENSKLMIGLVYRSPSIGRNDNDKLQSAVEEISQHDCVIMGDFNHGQVDWKSLTSANDEDRQFLSLVQDCGLKQCVQEPTRGENILDIVLLCHNVLVDKVIVSEPLGTSDHKQVQFDVHVNSQFIRRMQIQ